MTERGTRSVANFEQVTDLRLGDRRMHPTKVTRCKTCGWSTTARDQSLYGQPNALALEMLAHRVAHLEGRIK